VQKIGDGARRSPTPTRDRGDKERQSAPRTRSARKRLPPDPHTEMATSSGNAIATGPFVITPRRCKARRARPLARAVLACDVEKTPVANRDEQRQRGIENHRSRKMRPLTAVARKNESLPMNASSLPKRARATTTGTPRFAIVKRNAGSRAANLRRSEDLHHRGLGREIDDRLVEYGRPIEARHHVIVRRPPSRAPPRRCALRPGRATEIRRGEWRGR